MSLTASRSVGQNLNLIIAARNVLGSTRSTQPGTSFEAAFRSRPSASPAFTAQSTVQKPSTQLAAQADLKRIDSFASTKPIEWRNVTQAQLKFLGLDPNRP